MGMICVECGAIINVNQSAGSMKHPYCKPCFKKVWRNNYDAYFAYLDKTHGA
jgi:uncharacterized CHY-type Zn-finger protein